MRFYWQILVSVLAIVVLPQLAVAEIKQGTSTGLPIPRYVSVKSAKVNVRTGPGTRYPIKWVFTRDAVPVQVIEEFDLWRKIRDVEGAEGWVHKSMLDGSRHAFVQGKDPQIIRASPEAAARPLIKAQPMVVADVMECEPNWCRVQVSGRKGWIEKKHLWGVHPEEVFD